MPTLPASSLYLRSVTSGPSGPPDLNGYLPVSNLMKAGELGGSVGNRVQGTENCRRVRLVELINKLAAKPGWDVCLALRFLREKYEGT